MHLFDFLPPALRGLSFDFQDLMTLTIFGMTIVQIVPIKVNPWSALARWIGRILNADLNKKIDNVSNDVKNVKYENDRFIYRYERDQAVLARVRILRFGDEVSRGMKHSEENFEQVLSDIDAYEHYCQIHPEFRNNQTVTTTKLIKENYKERLEKRDFI